MPKYSTLPKVFYFLLLSLDKKDEEMRNGVKTSAIISPVKDCTKYGQSIHERNEDDSSTRKSSSFPVRFLLFSFLIIMRNDLVSFRIYKLQIEFRVMTIDQRPPQCISDYIIHLFNLLNWNFPIRHIFSSMYWASRWECGVLEVINKGWKLI